MADQNRLESNERELSLLSGKLCEMLSYFCDEIDFRGEYLVQIESIAANLSSNDGSIQSTIDDLKQKYLLSKRLLVEFNNFIPRFKYLNARFNALISYLESNLVVTQQDAQQADENLPSDSLRPTNLQQHQQQLQPQQQQQLQNSSAIVLGSKNVDFDEIRNSSVLLATTGRSTNVPATRKKKLLPNGNKGKGKTTKKRIGAKPQTRVTTSSINSNIEGLISNAAAATAAPTITNGGTVSSSINSNNGITSSISITNGTMSGSATARSSNGRQVSIQKEQGSKNKIVIRKNSRACPVASCRKPLGSAPSIKYHICVNHPTEVHRYKLGPSYLARVKVEPKS